MRFVVTYKGEVVAFAETFTNAEDQMDEIVEAHTPWVDPDDFDIRETQEEDLCDSSTR